MNIKIYHDSKLDINKPSPFWDLLDARAALVSNPNTPITKNEIKVILLEDDFIFIKDKVDYQVKEKSPNGNLIVKAPKEIYNNSSVFSLSSGNLMIDFSYVGNPQDEICSYLKSIFIEILSLVLPSRKTRIEQNYIAIDSITPKNPFFNFDRAIAEQIVVEKNLEFTQEELENFTNYNYKGIIGFDPFYNSTGYREFFSIAFESNKSIYNEYFNTIDQSKQAQYYNTSISEEGNKDYTRKDFIDYFVKAFNLKWKKLYPNDPVDIGEEKG